MRLQRLNSLGALPRRPVPLLLAASASSVEPLDDRVFRAHDLEIAHGGHLVRESGGRRPLWQVLRRLHAVRGASRLIQLE